jgi:hypothetical protein
MNVGAHVVWGAVLGLLTDQLVGRDDAEDGRRHDYLDPSVMASG